MPRDPAASLSSTFRIRGAQPKLTICTYSRQDFSAVTMAPESIRAWKSLVISTRDFRRSAVSSPGRLSTVSTGMPRRVNIRERSWLMRGSV